MHQPSKLGGSVCNSVQVSRLTVDSWQFPCNKGGDKVVQETSKVVEGVSEVVEETTEIMEKTSKVEVEETN